ncbi:MAG: c-type cytochrome [Nitrospinota bacterium]|nr:c-type cytochrome [Nitrospinota bacterium]
MFIVLWALLPIPGHTGQDGSLDEGKLVYMERCFQCHGPEGKGDGTAAEFLPRKPRDFTSGMYKLKSSPPDVMRARDEDIFMAISEGLLSNGMPSWKSSLSESQIWSLVVYVKSFSDLYDGEQNPPALKIPNTPRTADTVRWGRKAYFDLKCDDCHGVNGTGNPEKKLKDDYGRKIYPRNLTKPWTFIGPYTREALYTRVTNGIPATPMPPHYDPKKEAELSQQRMDTVDYIMSLAEQAEKERQRKRLLIAALAVAALFFGIWLWMGKGSREQDQEA